MDFTSVRREKAALLAAFSFCLILFLSGCVTSSQTKFISRLDQEKWTHQVELAGDFYLFRAISPAQQIKSDTINIVIEGDGLAWLSRYQISDDPTPNDATGFSIARNLKGRTAYLARPCQFVPENKKKNCHPVIWTSARFAPEVIASTQKAIDQIKQATSAQNVKLFGYSGGGTLAALITARRHDIKELVTIASPLDIEAWTRFHEMSSLKYSLNPATETEKWLHIPQRHYMGETDETVPPIINQKLLSAQSQTSHIKLITVPKFTHECCWKSFEFN